MSTRLPPFSHISSIFSIQSVCVAMQKGNFWIKLLMGNIDERIRKLVI